MILQLEKSDLGIGHTGGIQFTIGGPSGVLPKHPYDLMLESNFSYPAMGGCPKNAGTRILNEIVENDFEGKIPDDEYNTYNYIDHIIRQVVGTDKTMLLTSFITHDFFNRQLLENGTFDTLIPRLVDVSNMSKGEGEIIIESLVLPGGWHLESQAAGAVSSEHEQQA